MKVKAKILACAAAATMVSGCTVEEMQSFAIGAGVAALAISASQSNNNGGDGGISCDRGYRSDIGYDAYNEPVYFCVPDDEYYSQEELNALAREPR